MSRNMQTVAEKVNLNNEYIPEGINAILTEKEEAAFLAAFLQSYLFLIHTCYLCQHGAM